MKPIQPHRIIALCAVALLFPLLSFANHPKTEDGAKAFVNDLISDLGKTLNNKKLNKESRLATAEKQLRSAISLSDMANETIGPLKSSFTKEQYSEFADIYREYLIYSYLERIANYKGGQMDVTRISDISNDDTVAVQTLADTKRVKTVSATKRATIEYKLTYRRGDWSISNVVIEGVNINASFRAQFESMLKSKPPEEVIAEIDKLNARNAKKNPFRK